MDDMNGALDFLKILQKAKNINPEDMLPCLSSKDIKRTISDEKNKSKLIVILFIESSNPAINICHMNLSPIPKKSRMVLAYYVDIKQDQSVITDYKLKVSISVLLFKGGKEIERSEGMVNDETLELIEQKTPMDPFAGGSHKITDMDKVDTEEYWRSVRRPKQAPPPPPQNKPKKHSRYDDFIMRNNAGPQVPQNTPPPPPQLQPQPKPQAPVIPFLDPFSEQYSTLKEDLISIAFRQDEIEKSIIAGCSDLNECSEYIENVRSNQPNNQTLSYPGFNIDDLSPEQREIFETCSQVTDEETGETMLDTVQSLYVLLYTGVDNEDDFMNYIEDASEHKPLPQKNSNGAGVPNAANTMNNVDLELQRILGQAPAPQQAFSRTAPVVNQGIFDIQAQIELKKEYDEAKKRREDELKYKRQTLENIKKQRENAKREFESQNKAKDQTPQKTQVKPASPKTQGDVKKATIRFRLPNGTQTQYEFETTNTFEDVERKLKENKHINEEDIIEFDAAASPRIRRNDFGLQLQDKGVKGKIMMTIIVLPPPPPPQEEQQE